MHVLITGSAGMVGRRLAERLAREGQCAGKAIDRLTLTDVVPASLPPELADRAAIRIEDAGDAAVAKELAALRPDLIFHLAAIISGEAERDFDKGYRVNLDGMLNLLEAIRHEGGAAYVPKLVFTSSSGIFGAPFPASTSDEFHVTPLTSYGTQKAVGELLLADYSRRGFVDGVGIRFPSIVDETRKAAENRKNPRADCSKIGSLAVRSLSVGKSGPDHICHRQPSPSTSSRPRCAAPP